MMDSCAIHGTAAEKERAAVELPLFKARKIAYKLF